MNEVWKNLICLQKNVFKANSVSNLKTLYMICKV